MKASVRTLGLAVALAVAGGAVALHRALAQDGLPDASGFWEGKVGFKDYSMETGSNGNKGSFPCTLSWGQEGSSFAATFTVQTEEGEQSFPLSGVIGNGHFWAFNNDSESPILLSGHVSGSGSKMKMKLNGVMVDNADVNDLKISLKKSPITFAR